MRIAIVTTIMIPMKKVKAQAIQIISQYCKLDRITADTIQMIAQGFEELFHLMGTAGEINIYFSL